MAEHETLSDHTHNANQKECEMTKLRPLGDRLMVKVLEPDEVTIGGIILPDAAQEKPQRGHVLAVGPGARDENGQHVPLDIQVGETAIFSKYGGTEIKVGADEVLILRESDVLAVEDE